MPNVYLMSMDNWFAYCHAWECTKLDHPWYMTNDFKWQYDNYNKAVDQGIVFG